MTFPRRTFLHLAAVAASLPTLSRIARAQAYPTRPVRIIVGFSPGGTTDIGARLIAQSLTERLGQPFVVENRPGAGTHVATETVVRAPADGYTLLMATGSNAINATLYERMSYNFLRDITPVAAVIRSPFVLEVHPSVPVQTVPEFVAYAKGNAGKINMASFGTGTSSHLTGELFKLMTDLQLQHIPYSGSSPMLVDLIGGRVQVAFDNLPASIEHIKAGKLRALAVTTTTRSDALPDIPTMDEFLPGFESSAWIGLAAPKNTPAGTIETLNREINAAIADPKIKARFAELSGTVVGGRPGEFGKLIADETEKWSRVIREANVRAE
jgi:tripartite-type tricarboxylate transporter receptor subunit TctC